VFNRVFGHLRLEEADYSGKCPPAEPPLTETVTDTLGHRCPPKQAFSKTPPEAGTFKG
jgi:hypothetical protein